MAFPGELQFLMETDSDLCSTPGMLKGVPGMPMRAPGSNNSLADDSHALYPATPPQNILAKRCSPPVSSPKCNQSNNGLGL